MGGDRRRRAPVSPLRPGRESLPFRAHASWHAPCDGRSRRPTLSDPASFEYYIRDDRQEKREQNGWRGRLEAAVERIETRVGAVDAKLSVHSERFRHFDARIAALEEADEVTEVTSREQLMAKLKDARDQAEQLRKDRDEDSRWKRRWALGIVGSLLVMALGAGVGYAVRLALSAPAKRPVTQVR